MKWNTCFLLVKKSNDMYLGFHLESHLIKICIYFFSFLSHYINNDSDNVGKRPSCT